MKTIEKIQKIKRFAEKFAEHPRFEEHAEEKTFFTKAEFMRQNGMNNEIFAYVWGQNLRKTGWIDWGRSLENDGRTITRYRWRNRETEKAWQSWYITLIKEMTYEMFYANELEQGIGVKTNREFTLTNNIRFEHYKRFFNLLNNNRLD